MAAIVVPGAGAGAARGQYDHRPSIRGQANSGCRSHTRMNTRHAGARRRGDRQLCCPPQRDRTPVGGCLPAPGRWRTCGARPGPAGRGDGAWSSGRTCWSAHSTRKFLQVPQECLILTMKANQKYFPLLDAKDRLTNQFLIVSNISPADTSAVDWWQRTCRSSAAGRCTGSFLTRIASGRWQSRVEALSRVVYHNKLGSQGERMERVRAHRRQDCAATR